MTFISTRCSTDVVIQHIYLILILMLSPGSAGSGKCLVSHQVNLLNKIGKEITKDYYNAKHRIEGIASQIGNNKENGEYQMAFNKCLWDGHLNGVVGDINGLEICLKS